MFFKMKVDGLGVSRLRGNILSCALSYLIMERVPYTGASVYCQPPPPPDLLPVVVSASAEPVPAVGLPAVVPAVLRPHVVTVHTAHMTLFAQAMCNPAQVLSCGRHR